MQTEVSQAEKIALEEVLHRAEAQWHSDQAVPAAERHTLEQRCGQLSADRDQLQRALAAGIQARHMLPSPVAQDTLDSELQPGKHHTEDGLQIGGTAADIGARAAEEVVTEETSAVVSILQQENSALQEAVAELQALLEHSEAQRLALSSQVQQLSASLQDDGSSVQADLSALGDTANHICEEPKAANPVKGDVKGEERAWEGIPQMSLLVDAAYQQAYDRAEASNEEYPVVSQDVTSCECEQLRDELAHVKRQLSALKQELLTQQQAPTDEPAAILQVIDTHSIEEPVPMQTPAAAEPFQDEHTIAKSGNAAAGMPWWADPLSVNLLEVFWMPLDLTALYKAGRRQDVPRETQSGTSSRRQSAGAELEAVQPPAPDEEVSHGRSIAAATISKLEALAIADQALAAGNGTLGLLDVDPTAHAAAAQNKYAVGNSTLLSQDGHSGTAAAVRELTAQVVGFQAEAESVAFASITCNVKLEEQECRLREMEREPRQLHRAVHELDVALRQHADHSGFATESESQDLREAMSSNEAARGELSSPAKEQEILARDVEKSEAELWLANSMIESHLADISCLQQQLGASTAKEGILEELLQQEQSMNEAYQAQIHAAELVIKARQDDLKYLLDVVETYEQQSAQHEAELLVMHSQLLAAENSEAFLCRYIAQSETERTQLLIERIAAEECQERLQADGVVQFAFFQDLELAVEEADNQRLLEAEHAAAGTDFLTRQLSVADKTIHCLHQALQETDKAPTQLDAVSMQEHAVALALLQKELVEAESAEAALQSQLILLEASHSSLMEQSASADDIIYDLRDQVTCLRHAIEEQQVQHMAASEEQAAVATARVAKLMTKLAHSEQCVERLQAQLMDVAEDRAEPTGPAALALVAGHIQHTVIRQEYDASLGEAVLDKMGLAEAGAVQGDGDNSNAKPVQAAPKEDNLQEPLINNAEQPSRVPFPSPGNTAEEYAISMAAEATHLREAWQEEFPWDDREIIFSSDTYEEQPIDPVIEMSSGPGPEHASLLREAETRVTAQFGITVSTGPLPSMTVSAPELDREGKQKAPINEDGADSPAAASQHTLSTRDSRNEASHKSRDRDLPAMQDLEKVADVQLTQKQSVLLELLPSAELQDTIKAHHGSAAWTESWHEAALDIAAEQLEEGSETHINSLEALSPACDLESLPGAAVIVQGDLREVQALLAAAQTSYAALAERCHVAEQKNESLIDQLYNSGIKCQGLLAELASKSAEAAAAAEEVRVLQTAMAQSVAIHMHVESMLQVCR